MRSNHMKCAGVVCLLLVISVQMMASTPGAVFNPETVTINGLVWMKQNLHPAMLTPGNDVTGVSYQHQENIDEAYGYLYTYNEAIKACPEGWHLPSIEEWNQLFDFLGGVQQAGGPLKTVEGWQAPNTGANNLSGFSALPAGGGDDHNRFDGFGWSAHFWSDSARSGKIFVPSLMHDTAAVYVLELPSAMRASVRYIKD